MNDIDSGVDAWIWLINWAINKRNYENCSKGTNGTFERDTIRLGVKTYNYVPLIDPIFPF